MLVHDSWQDYYVNRLVGIAIVHSPSGEFGGQCAWVLR